MVMADSVVYSRSFQTSEKTSSRVPKPATGTPTGCVEWHLPPKGDLNHFTVKVRTGLHDLYAFHFKDHAFFNWEEKQELEYAVNIVFNESCEESHPNLFPQGVTAESGEVHL